jgi:hypothetical protein
MCKNFSVMFQIQTKKVNRANKKKKRNRCGNINRLGMKTVRAAGCLLYHTGVSFLLVHVHLDLLFTLIVWIDVDACYFNCVDRCRCMRGSNINLVVTFFSIFRPVSVKGL